MELAKRAGAAGSAASARNAETTLANALMTRYAHGEEAAFNELYRLLAPRLFRFCVAQCGRCNAEELLQEVFLKMHRTRTSFVDSGGVFAWAFTIARTSHLDRVRYQRRRPETATVHQKLEQHPANDVGRPDKVWYLRALTAEWTRELAQLSETLRAAYVLVKLHGMSCTDAGAALGVSIDTVKQRVHRATLSLKASTAPLTAAA
jgi:RNA polymerase sigma-70 factor (ECF subfamily)